MIHIVIGGRNITRRLKTIERKLDQLIDLGGATVADLSRITSEVQENTDVIGSAVTLLGSLAQQLRDNATDEAAINDLADSLDASSNELAAAVAANTPAEPSQ